MRRRRENLKSRDDEGADEGEARRGRRGTKKKGKGKRTGAGVSAKGDVGWRNVVERGRPGCVRE